MGSEDIEADDDYMEEAIDPVAVDEDGALAENVEPGEYFEGDVENELPPEDADGTGDDS